jgi:hypothetical protein
MLDLSISASLLNYVRKLAREGEELETIIHVLEKPWKWETEINEYQARLPKGKGVKSKSRSDVVIQKKDGSWKRVTHEELDYLFNSNQVVLDEEGFYKVV